MITLKTVAVIIILSIWFTITVIYQFQTKKMRKWFYRWDIFRLIPIYRFFAYKPRLFILSYRISINGKKDEWVIIDTNRIENWFIFLWNPIFMRHDITIHLMENLITILELNWNKKPIEKTVPYECLQKNIRNNYAFSNVVFQFRISEYKDIINLSNSNLVILFTSNFHE